MDILPQGFTLTMDIEDNIEEPTKTLDLDFEKGRLVGFCDNIKALKQSIYLMLNTERYVYPIFSDDYGVEFKNIIGHEREIAQSECKRIIKETLQQDRRIDDVDEFIFNCKEDYMKVSFLVSSIYGEFKVEAEVR
ncbi:MAG: DUF2634 domain-containing protein [Clostridium sp.]